jgi:hypothetical protein
MAAGLFQINKEWEKRVQDWEFKELKCLKCGYHYKEIKNIGKWQCKQHVLEYNEFEKGKFHPQGTWDCCGVRRKSGILITGNGCVRSDHTILFAPYTEQNDIYIPNNLIKLIVPFKESVVDKDSVRQLHYNRKESKPNDYIVRRYDWNNADGRQSSGHSIYSDKYS